MNVLSANLVTKSVGLQFLIVVIVIALALVGLMSVPALAQTTSTWSGGSGNWAPCPIQGGGRALGYMQRESAAISRGQLYRRH
jgi:hypothetical protein